MLESALLAAMIQSPSYYDPVEQETAALERRNYVLERMAAEGYLTSERAARLAGKDIKVDPIEVGLNFPAKLGYFLDYTRRELIDVYGEGPVFGGGLQVTTTLDSEMQRVRRGGRREPPERPGRPRGGARRDRPARTGRSARCTAGRTSPCRR